MDESRNAEALILALIYPLRGDDLSGEQIRAFNEAVDLQRAYSSGSAGGRGVKSRQAGDISVVYRDPGDEVSVCGGAVSPDAVAVLRCAGLLCRWV